jgi:hypothetical protein
MARNYVNYELALLDEEEEGFPSSVKLDLDLTPRKHVQLGSLAQLVRLRFAIIMLVVILANFSLLSAFLHFKMHLFASKTVSEQRTLVVLYLLL